MARRTIIRIDEQKCDGCGLCVPSCAEGAIQIRDGKAKLVSDILCDGLGACLGECPRGAITMVDREAEPFDQRAAERHVAERDRAPVPSPAPRGCPGSMVRNLKLDVLPGATATRFPVPASGGSALHHWPVQLRLVPPGAPFLAGADLLLVADCVPFAMADFHQRLLGDHAVVVGCPKLDDAQAHVEKLAAILAGSSIRSLTVVHMEVPCCTGLARIAAEAVRLSGANVPLDDVTVSLRGEILETV
jgi:ferredoxin